MSKKRKPTMMVDSDGTKRWLRNGELHREDGPAIEWPDGTKEWYLNGKRHREGGPAVGCPNGYKAWFLNGERHRKNGPAVEYYSGRKEWYLNGKHHRTDGPAIEDSSGSKAWYLDDVGMTEEEHGKRMAKKRKVRIPVKPDLPEETIDALLHIMKYAVRRPWVASFRKTRMASLTSKAAEVKLACRGLREGPAIADAIEAEWMASSKLECEVNALVEEFVHAIMDAVAKHPEPGRDPFDSFMSGERPGKTPDPKPARKICKPGGCCGRCH